LSVQGGELSSPGFGQGGELSSPASAVPARTMVKEITESSLFMLFMVFSFDLPKVLPMDCAMRGVSPIGDSLNAARAALNTSPKCFRQGFYHDPRKVGRT
jgi:hypothetical protein